MPRNKTVNKELEELKKRRRKAQDNGDISEEAKLCNVIGEYYSNHGDHEQALRYHCFELTLSEATCSESIDTAVAYRKVGECHCELGNYKEAIRHHNKYLEIATKLGNLVEIQRANTTLGRTYFIHGLSELDSGRDGEKLLTRAENTHLASLDVCNRLVGQLRDDEILTMRAGCYLNLGLVYENQSDLRNAHKFMEKALHIAKELGDSSLSTVLRCHSGLGSVHMKEHHPSMALRSYQAALVVAKKLRSEQHEIEVLKEITQVHFELSNFQQAKNCLKTILKLPQLQLKPDEVEHITRQLKVVRKIMYYEMEVEGVGEDVVQDKMELYDKLGDLCCSVNAFSAAIQFYGKLLNVTESHEMDVKKLSPIYVSLARTCTDSHLYSQALHWYNKDLELWKGNPAEECDTWTSIAKVCDRAGYNNQAVMEAYTKAADLAEQTNKVKLMYPQYKAIVKYCRTKDELNSVLPKWERKLSELLDSHPELAGGMSYSSDEDSQGLMEQDLSDTPPSLSSDENDEEEDEDDPAPPPLTRSTAGYAVRRKSKLLKKNEKGETLLHVASIEGNLPAVKQLLREGAEVNSRDHCGWLPLHEACNHGNLEVVRILLDNGASVNDPGGPRCDGVTPLIDAAINGHVDIVKLLVEKGANVLLKNGQGRTALDVVEERLAADPDEPNEEHKAIQEFLLSKMGRVVCEKSPPNVSKGRKTLQRDRLVHVSKSVTQTSTTSHQRPVRRDRSGASILYSSDEEDDAVILSRSKRNRRSLNKSIENSTSRISDSQFLALSRHKDTMKVSKQTSLPALVPQDDSTSLDEEDDQYPLVDNWLVDDIGEPPAKKQRSSSKEREIQSFIGGSTTRTATSSRSKGGSSQIQKKTFSNSSNVSRPKTKQVTFQRENSSGSLSLRTETSKKQSQNNVIIINSPEKDDGFEWLDDVDFEAMYDTSEFESLGDSTQAASETTLRTGTNESSLPPPQQPPSYTTAWPVVTHPGAPLRVRIRIEDKCYLIPCPRRNKDGSNVTIGWLTNQAIERYYSEHGGRPKLKLTTMDGALLCSTDALCDVLLENEEIMGVVEDLPLNERYQMACKNAGSDCHQQVLQLLRANTTSSELDFSRFGLTLRDCTPLFETIQSEQALTSLTLTGNCVLRAKGMVCFSTALSKFSNLEELDLSCTGITAQGLELLAKTSPGTWKGLHKLNLSFNSLGVVCGWSLAQLLKQCLVLCTLQLDSCMLSAAVFSELSGLCEALKNLRTLADLSISMNKLYSDGISSLIQSLPLSLSKLNIGATCSPERPVTEALNMSTSQDFFKEGGGESLEYIDLSCCGLTDDGVQVLVSCLEHSSKLRELKLAGNSITMDGIEPLCRLVTSKSSLRILDLGGNRGLGNTGSLRLIKACTVHGKCFLNLADCGIKLPFPEGVIQSISAAETGVTCSTSTTNRCYKWKIL